MVEAYFVSTSTSLPVIKSKFHKGISWLSYNNAVTIIIIIIIFVWRQIPPFDVILEDINMALQTSHPV
jgi:hypothetical protein